MRTSSWTGWIAFAGWLMIVIGAVDFIEGLIAVVRDKYYVLAPNQIVIFDMTTWGWLTLIWGILLVFVGWSLLSGASWARWLTIVAASINLLGQLTFAGSAQYTLWALTAVGLSIVVIYALIARWDDGRVQTTA